MIVLQNGKIIKYNVVLDTKKLIELKEEIIKNCSIVTHIKKIDRNGLYSFNSKIKNYHCRAICVGEHYNECMYEIEYDSYDNPILVEQIERLLKNDYSVIQQIFNPTILEQKDEKAQLLAQIRNISIDNLNKDSIELLTKLQWSLKEVLEKEKKKASRKPIEPYYLLVQECINLEKVDEISTDDFKRIMGFFDNKIEDVVEFKKKIK